MKNKKQKEFSKLINKTVAIVANSTSEEQLANSMRSLSRRERRLLLNEQKSRKKKENKKTIEETPIDSFANRMQMKTLDTIE